MLHFKKRLVIALTIVISILLLTTVIIHIKTRSAYMNNDINYESPEIIYKPKLGKYYPNITELNCYLEITEDTITLVGNDNDKYRFFAYNYEKKNMPIDDNYVKVLVRDWQEPRKYKIAPSLNNNINIAFKWSIINGEVVMAEGCHMTDENTIVFSAIPMIYFNSEVGNTTSNTSVMENSKQNK